MDKKELLDQTRELFSKPYNFLDCIKHLAKFQLDFPEISSEHVVTEILDLFSKVEFEFYLKFSYEYTIKCKEFHQSEVPWAKRALREDFEYGVSEYSSSVTKFLDPFKKLIEINKNEPEISLNEQIVKYNEVLQKFGKNFDFTEDSIRNSFGLEEEDVIKYGELLNKVSKDENFFQSDGDKIAQNIKRHYENYRYVNAVFLAIFDKINDVPLKKVEDYFKSSYNAYGDMFNYNDGKKSRNDFWRTKRNSLKSYFTNEKNNYPTLFYILKWVHNDCRFYRNYESHNLDNIKQEKLNERIYIFSNKGRKEELTFDDMLTVQNNLSHFFTILLFCMSFYSFDHVIQKPLIGNEELIQKIANLPDFLDLDETFNNIFGKNKN